MALNEIKEIRNEDSSKYSLWCETPLTVTNNLEFKWYKNEYEVKTNDEFEIINHKSDQFSTQLVFKYPNKNESDLYTCSLIYEDGYYQTTANVTFVVHFKCKHHSFKQNYKGFYF